MRKDEIVQLEPDVIMGIDYGDEPDVAYYCEMRRLPNGTLRVESFGRLIEGGANGKKAQGASRST